MDFTVKQIASLLLGDIIGNAEAKVNQLAKIDEEAKSGSICFLANPKYENFIYTTNATAVIVKDDFQPKQSIDTTLILVKDPYIAFTKLLEEYNKLAQQYNAHQRIGIEQPSFAGKNLKTGERFYLGAFAYVGNDCEIGDDVKIYPHCFVGNNVKIGNGTVIHPGAKIYDNTQIGCNCNIHAGAIIGSEGFGFAPQADGTYKSIPQLGNVILKDNVNIGANTTVDRATIGSTLIQEGVKLDNLIQIGHNVIIGEHTVMAAQAGIAGSTKIGRMCSIGGQVGIVNSIQIADYTQIGAKAGVNGSIKQEKTTVIGAPAMEFKNFMKSSVIFRKLPELQKRIEQLEEKILNLPPSKG
jgi:UDP-3-O-[3-hydroxymyristoyl] glucosamine N-acyltransferase